VKLNFDGSSFENLSRSRYGGLIHDFLGNLLYELSGSCGITTKILIGMLNCMYESDCKSTSSFD